jgi:hypothetical protein
VSYWTHVTDKGVFSIVERPSLGVDAYFGKAQIGHYPSPALAAEALRNGDHAELPCAPEDGRSLGVPEVHAWTFVNE